jgi:hypothetical protein
MDRSLQAVALIGVGRGALVVAMFGSGWLGWGLGSAKAFNDLVAPAFGFTALFLFACSIYIIRKGRRLGKQFPPADVSARRIQMKWFVVVAVVEAIAIALVSLLANRLHRDDLAADWCAMVVGLHFLPLAGIFRAPQFSIVGILMVVWCVLCWALFHSCAIAISASIGTGILLWVACVASLLQARRIARLPVS